MRLESRSFRSRAFASQIKDYIRNSFFPYLTKWHQCDSWTSPGTACPLACQVLSCPGNSGNRTLTASDLWPQVVLPLPARSPFSFLEFLLGAALCCCYFKTVLAVAWTRGWRNRQCNDATSWGFQPSRIVLEFPKISTNIQVTNVSNPFTWMSRNFQHYIMCKKNLKNRCSQNWQPNLSFWWSWYDYIGVKIYHTEEAVKNQG